MSTEQSLAVLFTDMAGSTELTARLSPADAASVRQTHFGILRRAVKANDGMEVKGLGDGIMAVFPTTSRAIAAAVDIQRRATDHTRRSEAKIFPRVGVSVGEVVAEQGD